MDCHSFHSAALGHGIPRAFSYAGHLPILSGVVSMRTSRWRKWAVAATAALLFSGASGFAQSGTTDESRRKVKFEVVIAPDGHVKTTRVVGGHPLLVQACQDAVKEWKFVPASEETTQVVEFEFHANN